MSDNIEQPSGSGVQAQGATTHPVEVTIQHETDMVRVRAHSPIIYW